MQTDPATAVPAARFEDFALSPPVLQALNDLGFEHPTPVQAQALPHLLAAQQDVIALAQTGTGKTAAFGLPLVEKIEREGNHIQAVILAPTRELCVQITRDLMSFAKHTPSLRIVAVYGGAAIGPQIRAVREGAQLVVATPGRLIDLMERDVVDLGRVSYVVLDEADEMLNMGFRDALDIILEGTPENKRVWLFSATMQQEVRSIAQRYMHSPLEVRVGRTGESAANLDHAYCVVSHRDKYQALKRLVDYFPDIFGVVFCRTKIEAQEVAEQLGRDGYNADSLHGDLTQQQRDRVMDRFRARTLQLLVATDVAARGIDVDNVTHVLHYTLPDDAEVYTHRSGRTARAGRSGLSISLVGPREVGRIRQIERALKRDIRRMPIPTGEEITQRRLLHLVQAVKTTEVAETQMAALLPSVLAELEGLDREAVIEKFLSYEFNHILAYYRNQPDLNPAARPEREAAPHDGGRFTGSDRAFTDLYLNLGTKDGLDRDTLLAMLNEAAGLAPADLGRLQMRDIKTYLEVPSEAAQQVMRALTGMEFRGRRVKAGWADNQQRGPRRPPRHHGDGRKPYGPPARRDGGRRRY